MITDHSPLLGAVRFCDAEIIEGLVKLGADIHTVNRTNSDAFLEALYGRKKENLLVIEKLGHTAKEYGGPALRHAVMDGDKDVVSFFLKHGTDINYAQQDEHYPQGDTPVAVAAQADNLEMVKFLAQQGADVTLCNSIGVRPYITALENGNDELAEYIKFLEPEEFHNQLNRLYQLKSFRLPKELVQFLQGDKLKLEFDEKYTIPYVTFFALQDTVEMQVGKRKLLRLSKETGKFPELVLVWMKKENAIGCYDIDHDELEPMASFREFMKEPAKYMEGLFE